MTTKTKSIKKPLIISVFLILGAILAGYLSNTSFVVATNYTNKINELKNKNTYYDQRAYELRKKADTIAGEIDFINQQKQMLQERINQISGIVATLEAEIVKLEKKIEDSRTALGEIITKIYIESRISTVERLASSKSITQFIDEEVNNQSLRRSVGIKIKEIRQNRKKIIAKKESQQESLLEQKAQLQIQQNLESEKSKILNETQGDENLYRNLVKSNNKEIERLRQEQIKINWQNMGTSIPTGVPGGGGYPGKWANAPLDAFIDPWDLYTRQCVSYVAWKLHSVGKYVPKFRGRGNANQWPAKTQELGINHNSTPQVGAAAVLMPGRYGHIMYVEAINNDGTIIVSDYNLGWDGLYREYKRSASGLTYIHFPEHTGRLAPFPQCGPFEAFSCKP